MFDLPIGLSTGCFYQRPILDCLEQVREAGFGTVEICSFPAHLDYHDHDACGRAARRLRELHLEPYSLHAPFAAELDITALDPDARQRACDEILLAADAAAILGVRHYVIHPGPEKSGIPRSERLDRMENAAAVLDRVAEHCRQLHIRLALENMLPHLFAGPVRDLLWLLGAVETTDVGICLDTGHAFLSGDLKTVAHKLSGHLWMIHASDNRGEFDDHLPPGEGRIPWRDFLGQLARSRFHGTLILEIAERGDADGTLAGAQQARALLRKLVNDIGAGG